MILVSPILASSYKTLILKLYVNYHGHFVIVFATKYLLFLFITTNY